TRFSRDWSSDVCSSDLNGVDQGFNLRSAIAEQPAFVCPAHSASSAAGEDAEDSLGGTGHLPLTCRIRRRRLRRWLSVRTLVLPRSEERRVGTACSAARD